jgi:anthranilate synthase component 2
MKILVIDNYDSFVYNLVHYIEQIGEEYHVEVVRNDEVDLGAVGSYDRILLSPGPGIPEEAGKMPELIQKFAGKLPILGVCLGHQAIAEYLGGKLENMKDVLHGISTPMKVTKADAIYEELPSDFNVGRYHSWHVSKEGLPKEIVVTAEDEQGSILSFKHESMNLRGVQYHPESVLTEHGLKIIENWLKKC